MATRTIQNVSLPSQASLKAAPRAYLELTGIDQAGPSYTAHVFLNNPQAGPDTSRTPEQGYLGAFHVYGYGYLPDAAPEQPQTGSDAESHTARAPMRRRMIADKEVLQRALTAAPTATVTIVPVPAGGYDTAEHDIGDALTVDGVSFDTNPEGMAPASVQEK